MDFYISRAMDIARLDFGQIRRLHEREQEIGRCLSPIEIRERFRLPSLKDTWNIPDGRDGKTSAAQESHTLRLGEELMRGGFLQGNGGAIEPGGSSGAEWSLHNYDMRIFKAVQDGKINFTFKGSGRKGSLLDEVNREEVTHLAIL